MGINLESTLLQMRTSAGWVHLKTTKISEIREIRDIILPFRWFQASKSVGRENHNTYLGRLWSFLERPNSTFNIPIAKQRSRDGQHTTQGRPGPTPSTRTRVASPWVPHCLFLANTSQEGFRWAPCSVGQDLLSKSGPLSKCGRDFCPPNLRFRT